MKRAIGPVVGAIALGALLVSIRGGLPGTPAADDYDYLHALLVERPLDPLGPMGSLWYWRPLGRQVYYTLLSPAFFAAPWLVAAVHAALLVALYALLERTARRFVAPLAAAALASFPLLAEPTRALLAWPTAAQPLLAMTLLALAAHEASAARAIPAGLALLAALLCHEQALLAVPAVAAIAFVAGRERGARRRALLAVGVPALVYAALRLLAVGHGAGLPPGSGVGEGLAALPDVLARSLAAQLGVTPGAEGVRALVPWLELGLFAAAILVCTVRAEARRHLARATPALLGGLAFFVLGILPLAFASELWTPRHTSLPGLGLAVFATGLLACAHPALALGLAAVRLVALLAAPVAPPGVPLVASAETTPFSFLHVTRLQRTADSARRVLLAAHPTLPAGTTVRYWSLPLDAPIAFSGPRAVRTWYADPGLGWELWERMTDEPGRVRGPVLAFNPGEGNPAVLMDPQAVEDYERALAAWGRDDRAEAEAAIERARRAQVPAVKSFTAEIVRLQSRMAFARAAWAEAESLNELDRALSGESASTLALQAMLALEAGDRAGAARAARRALALRPDDFEARMVLEALRATEPGVTPPGAGAAPGSPPGR